MKPAFDWLIHSPGGLLVRVSAGGCIFALLAVVDLRRNGRAATRWKEYGVLGVAVCAALAYGVVNDQITCTISPEYFLYGKELFRKIGESPTAGRLRWEAAKVGLMATWSAGLIFGVALLLANNPWRGRARLRNRELVKLLAVIPLVAAACGAALGFVGYCGGLTRWQSDFVVMVEADVYRPYRFMATWGVHLGGYIGGLLGTAGAVAVVLRRRIKISDR